MSLNGTLEQVGEALRKLGMESADPDREVMKELIAKLLRLIKPGEYGTQLFNALARLTVTSAVEACAFRRTHRGVEVLLRQRGPDEAYSGQFHCPGSVYRPGESDEELFRRLEAAEAMVGIKNPRLVGHHNHRGEERGHFVALIFLVDAYEGRGTEWYPVDRLPTNMVEHHRTTVIPMALVVFRQQEAYWGSL